MARKDFPPAEEGAPGAVLGAELSERLGYEKGDPAGRGSTNSRNGVTSKTVLTDDGKLDLAILRDRNGTFEPLIVPKGERRLEGFETGSCRFMRAG